MSRARGPVAALELCQVAKRFRVGDQLIEPLRGVDLAIHDRDYVSIIGPSGSGKSTLLHILGCLDQPDSGQVLIGGDDVSRLDDAALSAFRSRTLGFVFQKFHLLDRMSALRNVELPLDYNPALDRAARRERALACLAQVGLADRAEHRPLQLSGGQQQRVAIARALVNEPRILLLDEPTGNLDPATGAELMEFIDQLRREAGVAVVLVTHDMEMARRAERGFRLVEGRLEPVAETVHALPAGRLAL
ncbi:putative ABC transport system ATP-binding protein [Thioalbus denitrificans]|jgi:putative ABC transport system ATP-binding protein|uniref:Putative ABC transport system ATP-binding protein n=1 Tax=Thioalbus denitrificans TaxID=547122 RepID=A0A369CK94_9GAMM|nr:ABC transporter ATP-binding protein [Thioalbus denitrificans]RCX33505.1 putative ABC transport system ATP-binding protein [Thioalbus denitrificans]